MVGTTGGWLVSDAPLQEAFDKLNNQRMRLIARKFSNPPKPLSKKEQGELDGLNERVTAVVNALWPYPSIEELAERMGMPMPPKEDNRQFEMLFGCAPPDCAWCGEAHEGGPECCAGAEDNDGRAEGGGGAAEGLARRSRP